MYRKIILLNLSLLLGALPASAQTLGTHPAKYSREGLLLPWTSIGDALDREMAWYLHCPIEHGFPNFTVMLFMQKDYQPVAYRKDFIPAMQDGMGIISYLKYYAFTGKKKPEVLRFARYMGDYLVNDALTPNTGPYPCFPRSTGVREGYPQPLDAGCQKDQPFDVEPDKGAIAGYALALLYQETNDQRYLDTAVHIAEVLVRNMTAGDESHSPWPFRVDYRTGEARGPVSSDMTFPLRLFSKLIELKHPEFAAPRALLWKWISEFQIPNAESPKSDGHLLWVQFFEDKRVPTNRNAWAPLNLARYLIEQKKALDPKWAEHARSLIEFVNRNFTSIHFGVTVCGEQDVDRYPWGGVNSTYAAVLAMYASATGLNDYKLLAHQALTYVIYAIEEDGHPFDSLGVVRPWKNALYVVGEEGYPFKLQGPAQTEPRAQAWQEDAHTDVVHNIVDALNAFPDWR